MTGVLVALQVVCVAAILLSALAYDHPNMKPGGLQWELGIGFGIAVCALLFLIGPPMMKGADWAFFMFGQCSVVLYGALAGNNFTPGCVVVQTVQRHSRRPERRAREVRPEEHGDYIDYVVDKFRRVESVDDGVVTVVTRKGYHLELKTSDPQLRKPTLLERVIHHWEFPPKSVAA
jgi:hypothetical protein